LVELMNRYDLYQKDDEVGDALNDLEKVITELEKRIECVTRCNKDIRGILSIYEDVVEDFELLERSINDIDIALDLNDNEPIENNWYELFKPKRTIETEVSTETILIPKGSIVEWKETKQYYNAKGGAKARVTQDYTINHAFNDNYLMVEWLDDNANTQENGGYERDCFKEEFEQPKPPTFLCHSDDIHNVVKDVISKLKDIEVDGETMQYILKEVGMEEQMLKQLIKSCEHLEQVEEIYFEVRS